MCNRAGVIADIMVSVPNVRADYVRAVLNKMDNPTLESTQGLVAQMTKTLAGGMDRDLAVSRMIMGLAPA